MIARTKIFAIVTLLSVLVSKLDCICIHCHLSANTSEEVVKRFVILDFKRRLMEGLGMKTEPKVVGTAPMSIINAISRSGLLAGDQGTENYEEPSKINDIVFEPYAGLSFNSLPSISITYPKSTTSWFLQEASGCLLYLSSPLNNTCN